MPTHTSTRGISILEQIERAKRVSGKGFLTPAIISVQAQEKKSVLQIIAERQAEARTRGSINTPAIRKAVSNVGARDRNAGFFSRGFFAQAFVPTVQPTVLNPVASENISKTSSGSSGQIRNNEVQELTLGKAPPEDVFNQINSLSTSFRNDLKNFLGGIFGI